VYIRPAATSVTPGKVDRKASVKPREQKMDAGEVFGRIVLTS
jgi:hypothetical protein